MPSPRELGARLDTVLAHGEALVARLPIRALDRPLPSGGCMRDLAFRLFRWALAYVDGMDMGERPEAWLGGGGPPAVGGGAAPARARPPPGGGGAAGVRGGGRAGCTRTVQARGGERWGRGGGGTGEGVCAARPRGLAGGGAAS